MPSSLARSLDMTMVAEAPSESCDALPAVTLPVSLNDGFSLRSPSIVVSTRLHSSRSSVTSSNVMLPLASFTAFFALIGTISSLKRPSACARATRCWLLSAY